MKRFSQRLNMLVFSMFVMVVALASCTPEAPEQSVKKMIVADEIEVVFESEASEEPYVIAVYATDNEWQLVQDDSSMEWCTASTIISEDGTKAVSVSVAQNVETESREAYLTLMYDSASASITIIQVAADETEATKIECDSMVLAPKNMGEMEFAVEANGTYEVIIDPSVDWLSWENGSFYYSKSYQEMPRQTEVEFRSEYASCKVNFVQAGTLDITAEVTEFTVSKQAGKLCIPYEQWDKGADMGCSIVEGADWIEGEIVPDSPEYMHDHDCIRLVYAENTTDEERVATIVVTVAETTLNLTVRQLSVMEYDEVSSDKYQADPSMGVEKAEAVSQFSAARGALIKLFDGNDASWWATLTKENPEEVWLTYEFAAEQTISQIDYLRYNPTETVAWGQWGEIEVYLTYNGVESLLGKYDFGEVKTPSIITFDEPLAVEGLEKVTVKVLSATPFSETITKVASGSEFGLYQYNPDSFQILDYFTDMSCWELRPEVTWEQIEAIEDPFYRSMAEKIFNGDYNRFRKCLAKPYLHPDRDAAIFRNQPKTLLDGVTGMYVRKPHDKIILFLDEDYGQDIYLRVIDWFNDEGNAGRVIGHERATSDYRLKKGRNEIHPSVRGLMYIMWHTDDYATLPPVKINFATGVVNGYFNAETDDPKDFYGIMMQSGHKEEPHFDMITDNVVMNFTKANMRQFSFGSDPNNYERAMRTIAIFDTITRIQQIIQGFDKYAALGRERVYHNRAPFYGAYGDCFGGAGAYATVYGSKNMAHDILDPDHMWPQEFKPEELNNGRVGHCWGLAHELGHNNQTHQFGWRGLGEVSNNLMGAITQTVFFGEGHTTMRYNNHFNLSMADIVTRWVVDPDGTERHITHCESVNTPKYGVKRSTSDPNSQSMVDPTTQLYPFWQLYLYYHRALGKEDFYPDFYELCRLDEPIDFKDWFLPGGMESSEQNIRAMLDYMVKISKAAGEDLSGFCQDWHLPGINNRMLCSHYGQSIITTTQEQLDEKIAQCKEFPMPEMNPLYINDLNIDLYRNRTQLTAGSYEVDPDLGYYYIGDDWAGVAAWMLVDPATERVMGIYQGVDKMITYRYYTSIYEGFDPAVHPYRGQGCPEDSPYLTYNNGYQRFMITGPGEIRKDLELYGVDVWGNRHKGKRVE